METSSQYQSSCVLSSSQFQSPDSYMSFYTLDGAFPQLITSNSSNNINNNNDNKVITNNIFAVSSLGADDFRKVAIPERNKVKSIDKPKSSLTMLLESRPEHPNICDDDRNNSNSNNEYSLDYTENNSHLVNSLPSSFVDINTSYIKNNEEREGELNSNISFTDLIQLVTEEENNLSKSQCEIYPTEEDGSVIDYLPDISKTQSILDFGLQDFVVVDKKSSKPLMHVHIGMNNSPSPTLEKSIVPIPSIPSPIPVNDSHSSEASGGSVKDSNLSYYDRLDGRERASSESCVGPFTIYYKKVGANNWSIAAGAKNMEQLSSSTSSSTPTSVSSFHHPRGTNQKLSASGVAKSLPEERLDSSLYSPVRSYQFNNTPNSNNNISSSSNVNSNNGLVHGLVPKIEMMKTGPFAFCQNILSSSDSSDSDSDDDNRKKGTWGYSR